MTGDLNGKQESMKTVVMMKSRQNLHYLNTIASVSPGNCESLTGSIKQYNS